MTHQLHGHTGLHTGTGKVRGQGVAQSVEVCLSAGAVLVSDAGLLQVALERLVRGTRTEDGCILIYGIGTKRFQNGRAHFMTERFDRDAEGGKIHVQSLCVMAHYDFNAAGEYSYEQAFSVVQRLNLGYPAVEEMYRRMVFNVVACNQDDHTRNIAFLMDRDGTWRLAPAFDVVWAYNSKGTRTNRQQMTVNGKRDDFERTDLVAVADTFGVKGAADILDQVAAAVAAWESTARDCGVDEALLKTIGATHRTNLL